MWIESPGRTAVAAAFVVFFAAAAGLGCAPHGAASPVGNKASAARPPLPAAQTVAPGVARHEVTLPTGKIWVYLPERKPAANGAKLPVVLIAPAGTRLFHGIGLAQGDAPEHLPYVRGGFAVVAYEISGPLEGDSPDDAALLKAARTFRDADAGVANARAALDYALATVPSVDPARVYTAGHSSAATLSLLVAANEPRVKACVAFAPAADVEGHLGEAAGALDGALPGYREFLARHSPKNNAARLRCPVFLFHAADDTNVPAAQTEAFAAQVRRTNPRVTFVRAPSGGHYDPMIQQGIPQAIAWLRGLDGKAQ